MFTKNLGIFLIKPWDSCWGIELNSIGVKITCNVCIKSKITCKPLPKDSGEWAKKLGEKVYSDIWGPSRHLMTDRKLYYVSLLMTTQENWLTTYWAQRTKYFQDTSYLRQWCTGSGMYASKLSSQIEGVSIQVRNLKIIYLGRESSIS